jgi:hypothetical protein
MESGETQPGWWISSPELLTVYDLPSFQYRTRKPGLIEAAFLEEMERVRTAKSIPD